MDSVFTAKELVTAVELMISKQDIRNQPRLCMEMLQYFGYTAKDIAETLRAGNPENDRASQQKTPHAHG